MLLTVWRLGDLNAKTPLKQPGLFRMIRHELDSPNLGGHLPHPCYNVPLRPMDMGVVGKNNWTAYRSYLLSDLRMAEETQGKLAGSRFPSGYRNGVGLS
ncbi:hypothetical protein AVEN_273034-1 [Araneus ventricosus]|uniref:Uncharacterized protein n=1 Tax=Araneus ventricosus TaxID=182803 RepID=A0A4Y2H7I1_ARAVE|nr:hypothetical protein AVEN_273034-1 [Araneus ventricosus]